MHSDRDLAFLPPAQSEELLPPIGLWTILSGTFLVGACTVAMILAATVKYNVVVKANATVRPAGELRLVQTPVAGTIKSIKVKENQIVESGEILAYLDDSRLQTQISQLQGNIKQAKQQLEQLAAQINLLDRQVIAETALNDRAIAFAEAEFNLNNRHYRDSQITSTAQVQEAEANLRQAENELTQVQTELQSAKAILASSEASLQAAITKKNRYQTILKSGAIAQQQFDEAKLEVEQQRQTLNSQKALVAKQHQIIEEQQQAIEAAKARLKGILAASDPTDAEVTMAQEKIAQAKAMGQSKLSLLAQQQEQNIERQAEIQNQLNSNQDELKQIETELRGTVIRASATGTIQELNLRNDHQFVQPGDIIAKIAPGNSLLEIKALAASQDIDRVEIGQTVQMRVSACPYPDYGTLQGTVRSISPDAAVPEKRHTNALKTIDDVADNAKYEVTIEPKSRLLTAFKRDCVIKPGMEGRADIISRKETVLQFVLRKARLITDL